MIESRCRVARMQEVSVPRHYRSAVKCYHHQTLLISIVRPKQKSCSRGCFHKIILLDKKFILRPSVSRLDARRSSISKNMFI